MAKLMDIRQHLTQKKLFNAKLTWRNLIISNYPVIGPKPQSPKSFSTPPPLFLGQGKRKRLTKLDVLHARL